MSELPPMSPRDERMYDLLIARDTLGLSDAESRELTELLASVDAMEREAMEEAVAAIGRAFDAEEPEIDESSVEPMPETLRTALYASVAAPAPALTSERSSTAATSTARSTGAAASRSDPRDAVIAQLRWSSRLGWLAAAASVVVAAGLLFARGGGSSSKPTQPNTVQQLVDASTDVVRIPIGATPDGPAGAAGEVVWSDRLQQGYMRLSGVPANDAASRQYQLWIVDPSRSKEPVDGGVFDVAAASEVVVPFSARLPVDDPKVFAVTAEKPGGVVVSAGPLLLVAQAK
jgi:anti-sigma-K factor RskA